MKRRTETELGATEIELYGYISARIREAREGRGMSQERLAWFLYKSQRAVSDIERGHAHINLIDLLTAASALEKPVPYFLLPAFTEGLQDDFTSDERELIHFYRQIRDDIHKAIAVQQLCSIVEAERRADVEDQRSKYESHTSGDRERRT